MANALKCDRCKKCFDPLNMIGETCRFLNPRLFLSEDISKHIVTEYLIDADPDAYIDLCPECSKEFRFFILGMDREIDSPNDILDKAKLKEIICEQETLILKLEHDKGSMDKTISDLMEARDILEEENEKLKYKIKFKDV